jgi:RTC4-like domain
MRVSTRRACDASIRRTKSNGPPEHLLKTINGKRTDIAASSSLRDNSPTSTREKSIDTDAEPLSSSEDEKSQTSNGPVESGSRQHFETRSELPLVQPSVPAKHRGSKRKMADILQDTDPDVQETVSEPIVFTNEFSTDEFFISQSSQSSNKRRRQNLYRTNRFTSSSSPKTSFNPGPAPIEAFQSVPDTADKLNIPRAIPQSPREANGRNRIGLSLVDDPGKDKALEVPVATFFFPQIPDLPGSSSTIVTDVPQVFDDDELTTGANGRNRSGSTSSLSSSDSGASLVLTQGQKIALMENDAADSNDTARCPLCRSRVERSHLEEFNLGRKMNVRAQQRFCQEHKEREARSVSDRHGYPEIDWEDLKTRRIPQHIPHLEKVLRRRVTSYYHDKLGEVANDRKKLRRYLRQGIVDVVKHGYYGPKGARTIGNAISVNMSKALSEALKRDKIVKAAEVGGFVSAVLAPELMVRLVMEDMKVSEPDGARKILAESAELGVALHGDDDERVTRREDD